MPPPPKGEMSLSEIRNLVRQHNKMSTISPAQTRPKLLAAITDAGYKVDHVGKKLCSQSICRRVYGRETCTCEEEKGSSDPGQQEGKEN